MDEAIKAKVDELYAEPNAKALADAPKLPAPELGQSGSKMDRQLQEKIAALFARAT